MIVVLFDVDGTLTRGRGAGARALERAFRDEYGWDKACVGLRFQGGTDRGLVRTVLEGRGALEPDPSRACAQIEAVLARYVEVLPSEIPSTPYRALPGAAALLEALAAEAVAVGLVTGNHPMGAEQKLRSAGLWGAFAFGAYGSESEDRAALVRLAVRRASSSRPGESGIESVYVVGDTEHDVRAAHGAGAKAVAVLTGGASRETLEAERPFALFTDLQAAHRAGFWRG